MQFHLRIPCDGIFDAYRASPSCDGGKCHESLDRVQCIRFGELEFMVTVCGHMWDSCARKEIIYDLIGDLYAPLCLSSKDDRKFGDDMLAYRSGICHEHSWDLCSNVNCGREASWCLHDCETRYDDLLYERYRMSPYCSFQCWAQNNLNRCCVCGGFNEAQLSRTFCDLVNAQCVAVLSERECYSSELFSLSMQAVCSKGCLADHVKHMESCASADLKRKGEVQCLKKVRVLLRDAKRHLRNNNLEALASLKGEFEQVATSQE